MTVKTNRVRPLHSSDWDALAATQIANPGKRIKVYSLEGFAPASAPRPTWIEYVEAAADGSITTGWEDARRCFCRPTLEVIS